MRQTSAHTEDPIRRRLAQERGNRFVQGGPRVALLYPSPYRAGMSSLGFQWILSILQDAGYSVERVFLPDDIEQAQRRREPLLTYESKTPLSAFPLIGISLAYELELAGLIQALSLAGIPPCAPTAPISIPACSSAAR